MPSDSFIETRYAPASLRWDRPKVRSKRGSADENENLEADDVEQDEFGNSIRLMT